MSVQHEQPGYIGNDDEIVEKRSPGRYHQKLEDMAVEDMNEAFGLLPGRK